MYLQKQLWSINSKTYYFESFFEVHTALQRKHLFHSDLLLTDRSYYCIAQNIIFFYYLMKYMSYEEIYECKTQRVEMLPLFCPHVASYSACCLWTTFSVWCTWALIQHVLYAIIGPSHIMRMNFCSFVIWNRFSDLCT